MYKTNIWNSPKLSTGDFQLTLWMTNWKLNFGYQIFCNRFSFKIMNGKFENKIMVMQCFATDFPFNFWIVYLEKSSGFPNYCLLSLLFFNVCFWAMLHFLYELHYPRDMPRTVQNTLAMAIGKFNFASLKQASEFAAWIFFAFSSKHLSIFLTIYSIHTLLSLYVLSGMDFILGFSIKL